MIGRVTSTKLQNTATVLIERVAKHPLYKKTFIRTKKYLVDDLLGVKDGDIVQIQKCRPISKNKHWRIVSVVGKNLTEIIKTEQKKTAEEAIAEVLPEKKEEVLSDKGKVISQKKEDSKLRKEKKGKA